MEYETSMELCPTGNSLSCETLGDGYLSGRWGSRNPAAAARYLEMSCSKKGYGDACMKLAAIYESGELHTSDEHLYEIFSAKCSGFEKDGCEGMRKLAGKTGRMPYADARRGVPDLRWYCSGDSCFQDPKACRGTQGDNDCKIASEASCFLGEKPGSVFWACAPTVASCTALIQPVVASTGGKAISACSRTNPTPPGLVPGNDWYCAPSSFASGGDCQRDLAQCQSNIHGSFGGQCAPQQRAACVVYFDRLNDKYAGACFASLQVCNSSKSSLEYKDDFSEFSECFAVD
jgi:hypothetical protein